MRLLSSRTIRLCAILWIACLGALRADAQNSNLNPSYGATTLKAGFTPDPRSKSLVAGGAINVSHGGINAFISDPPSFRLSYSAVAGKPLVFYVRATGNTTLLVKLPDGSYLADDDSSNGYSPQIRLPNPKSGDYNIWVGTFRNQPENASLWFSQNVPTPDPKPKPNPNPNPKPNPNPVVVAESISVDQSTVNVNGSTLSFRLKIDPPNATVKSEWTWAVGFGNSAAGGLVTQGNVGLLQQVTIPAGTVGPLYIDVRRDNTATARVGPISIPMVAPVNPPKVDPATTFDTLTLTNRGAYVARFRVTWRTPDGRNGSWQSGDLTAVNSRNVTIPTGSTNIRVHAENAWFISSWRDIFNGQVTVPGAYTAGGTTLNTSWSRD